MDPLLVMLSASVDTLSIELKDKLHYFEEFMPEVVKQAEMAINQAQLYLQQYPPLQPHQKPQAGPLSDRNRNTILPLQQQQQELGILPHPPTPLFEVHWHVHENDINE